MKLISRGLLAMSVIAFVGCSNNSDDNFGQAADEARPKQLDFKAPAVGAPLTKEQVNEIKNVFSQKPSIEIPPSELLLKDQDSKLSDQQLFDLRRKEIEFQYTASPESYAFYKALRSTCSKQHGTLSFEATVPLEKITKATDVKTGDHLTTSLWGEYGGGNCAAEVSGKTGYQVKADRIEKDGLASAEASYSLKALLKNPVYAQLLKSKGIVASSSISGVVAKQNVDISSDEDITASLKFNIDSSYFTLTNEIPVKTNVVVFGKPMNEAYIQLQIEINASIAMPTFSANVVAQLQMLNLRNGEKSTTVVENYYVNGHRKTAEELKELFGNKFGPTQPSEMAQVFMN